MWEDMWQTLRILHVAENCETYYFFKKRRLMAVQDMGAMWRPDFFCIALFSTFMRKKEFIYMDWVHTNKVAMATETHSLYLTPFFCNALRRKVTMHMTGLGPIEKIAIYRCYLELNRIQQLLTTYIFLHHDFFPFIFSSCHHFNFKMI